MRLIFAIFLTFINSLEANPEKGKAAIDVFLQDQTIKNLTLPDYQAGANYIGSIQYEREPEKQAIWRQNQSLEPSRLEQAGANHGLKEILGAQIIKADNSRPRFDEIIDLKLIATAEKFSENPNQELIIDGIRERVVTQNSKYEIKTCQHSRAPEEHQCIKYLKLPQVTVIPERIERNSRSLGCFHRRNENLSYHYSEILLEDGKYHPARVTFHGNGIVYAHYEIAHPKQVIEEGGIDWISECHALEARKATNECKVIKEECLDKEPHVINGETIIRPCWKYQYTYECKYPVKISCEPLLNQGCSPLNSKCVFTVKQQEEDKCYIWEQKYQCPLLEDNVQQSTKYERPFCLEGECFNTDYAPNDEMLASIAQLDVFAQMQADIKADVNYIFKGATQGCNRLCIGIKNCCKLSGWAKDLGLVDCSETEKQLAENRRKGLCVKVGRFCAERAPITGICLRRKTNFCCFHSKLTKAIQEQGRIQLDLNFGSPKEPNCRGLTIEELTRIDFSKLNLVDAFSDLKPKLKNLAEMNQKLQQKLKEIQADFKTQMQGEK